MAKKTNTELQAAIAKFNSMMEKIQKPTEKLVPVVFGDHINNKVNEKFKTNSNL